MARVVNIGAQSFETMRTNNAFYIDKTTFIKEWWETLDQVTLVCRPRRFGKTLMLDMVRCFLSYDFAGRGEELFGGLAVWEYSGMRALQGTVPVVSLSFARCKGSTLDDSLALMKQVIRTAVRAHDYLRESNKVSDDDRAFLRRVSDGMDDVIATTAINQLCSMLRRHHGVPPVVLLDEYDTPMQEAWAAGYWDGMASFVRQLFNATFKTNPALGRALVTGVTRVASESIFSDLNNPRVVTTTTPQYETAFGFTEAEVGEALGEFDLADTMDDVRHWYDGFTFGRTSGIYNPWSITCYLKDRELDAFWANSSSNALVSTLVRQGDDDLKSDFENLLAGGTVDKRVDERVDFRRLMGNTEVIWSLLLATGYLRIVGRGRMAGPRRPLTLAITSQEVMAAFDAMVSDWFVEGGSRPYNQFCRSLLAGDTYAMNHYLAIVTRACISSFDGGTHPSEQGEPERFYHGLVLGMLVELRGRYVVESNRESGLGRYDVALVPAKGARSADDAILIEFKVFDGRRGERSLEDTVASALAQIEDKGYAAGLVERGFAPERIRRYGFAFRGKEVLIG